MSNALGVALVTAVSWGSAVGLVLPATVPVLPATPFASGVALAMSAVDAQGRFDPHAFRPTADATGGVTGTDVAAATPQSPAGVPQPGPTIIAPPASPAPPARPPAQEVPPTQPAQPAQPVSQGTRLNPRAVPSTGGVRYAPTGRGPLSGRTIVVDPGHNGRSIARVNNRLVPDGRGGRKACNTTGTASNTGYTEHAHNWAVGNALSSLLRQRGATVVMTRPTNTGVGPCVDERAAIGNRAKADLVISIHADGAAASARGFHIIRSAAMAGGSGVTARSSRLATMARDQFARATGLPRSTYLGGGTGITPRRDIAGLNLSRVPAVMLEAGNMRNRTEAALLRSPAFQKKEAAGLAAAAQQFLR